MSDGVLAEDRVVLYRASVARLHGFSAAEIGVEIADIEECVADFEAADVPADAARDPRT